MPSFQGTGGGGGSIMGTARMALGIDNQDKLTLQKLNALYKEAKDARQPYDAEAWLNLAFFLNEQYVEWPEDDGKNGTSLAIRRIPRKKGEEEIPRPVFNKIQNYIYTAHNETLQDKPAIDVLPANDDFTAAMDADVNKAYLNYVMEPLVANWDIQLARASLWALIAPAGWLKWTWDPVLKRPDVMPPSYFDVYPDPFAKEFGRARHVFHTMFMARDDIEDLFDVKIDAAETGVTDELRVKLLRGMGSAPLANGVEVRELWMKPNKRHPRGMYALFTERTLLKLEDALPYEYLQMDGGHLPFTQLGSLLRPDSLFYTSPVTALRPAQMVWNKFVAQAIMTQDHFANLKWWIPEELQLQQMPDSSPHQILRGNAGSANLQPTILTPGGVPDQARMLDIFEQQMMHVVSVHEVSQGQVPGRVEAAKAIELLKSSDQGMYKHLLDTIDQSIAIGGWQILMMGKEFETPEKQVLTYSKEGMPLVKHWRAEAVHPGTQVRAVRMSGLGRTRAQRTDTLMLLWQNKVITDPDVMAELMDTPIPSFTNPRAHDMRLARAENIEMAAGIPVRPNSWDNHAIHLRELNEFRKTQEYRALGPVAKAIFEWHAQGHESLQILEAQKMARLMMAGQPVDPAAAQQPGSTPPGAAPGSAPGTEAPPENPGGGDPAPAA
jgi:hypothetical protein